MKINTIGRWSRSEEKMERDETEMENRMEREAAAMLMRIAAGAGASGGSAQSEIEAAGSPHDRTCESRPRATCLDR